MANPDVSAISAAFNEFGGQIISKNVNQWNLRQKGIQVRLNVNKPQVMPKISALGSPRPYSAGDNTASNGVKFTDRTLTAYQSKWDHDFDPEEFRNTYLANDSDQPYYVEAINQVAKEYLAYLNDSTLYLGVRNGAGTTPAAICDGWGTIIAAEITATNLTPIVTGSMTDSNAVFKFEQMVEDSPAWLREKGGIIYCSWGSWDLFTKHYRTLNNYQIKLDATDSYKLDNKNVTIVPVSFMGTSDRLIYTMPNNLVFGTDLEQVATFASMRRNIIEVRHMMPAGCQIADLDALFVNDQA